MTLAAFKRAIRVGMTINVVDHWQEKHCGTQRHVTKVQGNGYWFTVPGHFKPDGVTPVRYWGDYPKASQLKFDGRLARIDLNDLGPQSDRRRHWTLELPEAT